ncbi:MAG: dihydrodipicolinate synthase family protein [Tissierellia bacterium]|nr:dihydrodipicolinate synthase family protein [Tissierellia bacterium]
MSLNKYRGILPAFYACYDEDGEISREAVGNLTRYFIEKGVKGVYVNGSSGECIYQSVKERKAIIEEVMSVAKGKLTVINHVACNNTRDSMILAEHSEKLGVDAIAAIPPIYFKLPEYSIAQYWNRISQGAPQTDFIIYNIPQLAGTALTLSLFDEMLKNDRVIGVKNSSMPTMDIQLFKRAGVREKEDFIVFNGPDEQFVSGRAMGADGGIGGTYAVMPELFLKLDEWIKEGERKKALELQYDINEIIYKMCSGRGNMYALAKEVLRVNENLDLGGVREPLENLHDGDFKIAKDVAMMITKAKEMYL